MIKSDKPEILCIILRICFIMIACIKTYNVIREMIYVKMLRTPQYIAVQYNDVSCTTKTKITQWQDFNTNRRHVITRHKYGASFVGPSDIDDRDISRVHSFTSEPVYIITIIIPKYKVKLLTFSGWSIKFLGFTTNSLQTNYEMHTV